MADHKPHTIAMSGATGFVGSHLQNAFRKQGWQVIPLNRKDLALPAEELAKKINGADVVVNLAGAPVIQRWTKAYKKVLYQSRINVTRNLVQACACMEDRPKLLISTSAIGYYADQGVHNEEKYIHADTFLGNLTGDWEKEALKAEKLEIRTVIFRFGIVLAHNGGALKQMLLPFKFGLGGKIGSGLQPFSWIHIHDLLQVYQLAINSQSFSGIYNLTAPQPTTNLGLTKAIGKALCRPTLLRVPSFVLRLQFGEGAQTITGGQAVIPKRLMESGFKHQFTHIETAVKDCLS